MAAHLDGKVPDEVVRVLAPALEKDEKILFSQHSDLTEERCFGES
ncbi:MAG: hypothetical protein NTW87_28650 [Planctomycetota bacterium]|nr:hypothetical protein [Planctomycetota bacterium]